jgi:hypothetical protein
VAAEGAEVVAQAGVQTDQKYQADLVAANPSAANLLIG